MHYGNFSNMVSRPPPSDGVIDGSLHQFRYGLELSADVDYRFAESSELIPHSVLPLPAHLPERGSSPICTGRVQESGLQPMLR